MKFSITFCAVFAIVGFLFALLYLSPVRALVVGVACAAVVFATLYGLRMLFRKISLRGSLGVAVGGLTGGFLYYGLFMALGEFPVSPEFFPELKVAMFVLLVSAGAIIGYDKTLLGTVSSDSFFRKPEALAPKILDTSVIIDGRIADIVQVGFLEGEIVVPKFVIQELQYIADSSDLARKTRGRRGLDIITRMQNEIPSAKVRITDQDFDHIKDVDIKLIELSKRLNGALVTNDFNLKKIADLEKVTVLNINELNHALWPVVEQGEKIRITLAKPGKEQNQAVGYLDDGTTVIVDNATRHIGKEVEASVKSMVQTPTGRTVFARLKKEG